MQVSEETLIEKRARAQLNSVFDNYKAIENSLCSRNLFSVAFLAFICGCFAWTAELSRTFTKIYSSINHAKFT